MISTDRKKTKTIFSSKSKKFEEIKKKKEKEKEATPRNLLNLKNELKAIIHLTIKTLISHLKKIDQTKNSLG